MDATWRVVTTVPTTGFDPSGRAVPGRNVTYQLTNGTAGTVFIPGNVTDTAAIKAIIQEDADRAARLSTMTSDS